MTKKRPNDLHSKSKSLIKSKKLSRKKVNTRKYKFLVYKWIDEPVIKVPFEVEGTKGNVRDVTHVIMYIRRSLLEKFKDITIDVSFSKGHLDDLSTRKSNKVSNDSRLTSKSGLIYIPEKNLYIEVLSTAEYNRFDIGDTLDYNLIKVLDTTTFHNPPYLVGILKNLVEDLPNVDVRKSTTRF